ncbi:hypothetical protein SYJ56_03530 [Algoriphagus sp. D3-2-R+10]|uniref:hypothetical protein n=1 Tax=Algoriphagus aurantiacus TaxID=3103948 RepID=UPI002B3F3AC2|nr:hypothetical protein [Algoriphagus sp. D3-2-R+10]MEB2774360.1 hypothetical protein [Algoriphagus sp. D3-2-R+10]
MNLPEEVRELWKFEATLSKELPAETLTLHQIGLSEIESLYRVSLSGNLKAAPFLVKAASRE